MWDLEIIGGGGGKPGLIRTSIHPVLKGMDFISRNPAKRAEILVAYALLFHELMTGSAQRHDVHGPSES